MEKKVLSDMINGHFTIDFDGYEIDTSIRRMENSFQSYIHILESSISRCLNFASSEAATVLAVLDEVSYKYIDFFESILGSLRTRDWSLLNILRVPYFCKRLVSEFGFFVRSTLGTMRNTNVAAFGLVGSKEEMKVSSLLDKLEDPEYQVLEVTFERVKSFAEGMANFVMIELVEKVGELLEMVPQVKFTGVPKRSPKVKKLGDILIAIHEQLYGLRELVEADVLADWMRGFAEDATRVYTIQLPGFEVGNISAREQQQVYLEATYLTGVFDALAVPVPGSLKYYAGYSD